VTTRKIIRLKVTESTNSVALEAGQQGAVPGTVIVAETQTGGRGRLNRSWLSLPGMGLYFTIILRPKLDSENLPKVTLAAGLALCKAVEAEYGLSPKIKWPNDLLLDGRKFGGILTETGDVSNMAAGEQPLVVVGVGLNLFPPEDGFPDDLQERATALSLHVDRTISDESLLLANIVAIEKEVERLEKGDFALILKEWTQRDGVYGKNLTWVTHQGHEVTGVSLGPDDEGLLRIKDQAGDIHTVISGDLTLATKFSEKS
jgi:BirA family biotin operon repressor/biotin-[acetyl-CoA-carboxylase] ligase